MSRRRLAPVLTARGWLALAFLAIFIAGLVVFSGAHG